MAEHGESKNHRGPTGEAAATPDSANNGAIPTIFAG